MCIRSGVIAFIEAPRTINVRGRLIIDVHKLLGCYVKDNNLPRVESYSKLIQYVKARLDSPFTNRAQRFYKGKCLSKNIYLSEKHRRCLV